MPTYSISDFTDTILLSHHSELYRLVRSLFKMRSILEDNFNALWCDHLEKLKLAEEKHGLDDVRFKFSVPRISQIRTKPKTHCCLLRPPPPPEDPEGSPLSFLYPHNI